MFDLTGKTALVTGASGGIGGAIAATLHRAGATVALHGTRREALDGLAAQLGERVHVLPANLSSAAEVERLAKDAGNPGQANYCAAKAGMIGLSKSLAQEVASRGITVNCVAPGFIASAMTGELNDDQKARILSGIPLGRMGSAEEISAAVLYLASAEAAYVTGQTLHVNGGLAMI